MEILELLHPDDRRGGVVTTRALRSAGLSHLTIRRLTRHGTLARIRRGWYALPVADDEVVVAVRRGGVMSCCSALAFHGVWVADDHHHLRTSRHATERLGRHSCCRTRRRPAPARAVDDVDTALELAMDCLGDEELLVVMDSLVDKHLLSREEIEHLATRHRRRVTGLCHRMGPAQSGLETMVRFRLEPLARSVTAQVPFAGIGRVDLLVDGWLVVECDGRRWHDSTAWQSDRTRDRRLAALGAQVVRLSHDDIRWRWDAVLDDLRAILARGPSTRHRPRGRRVRRQLHPSPRSDASLARSAPLTSPIAR